MSYQVGQLRRDQIATYTNDLAYTLGTIETPNDVMDFTDACMNLSAVLSYQNNYYLHFEVNQLADTEQDFYIKLKNTDLSEDNTQVIRTLNVKKGSGKTSFEIIFNPNNTYNKIVFELKRTNADFTKQRNMTVNVIQFSSIVNIVETYLTTKYQLKEITKIGIQGPPGLLFTIGGEEIRVGRSGIYELYDEDIKITSIGFVIKESSFTQDGKDFFIMDFKY